MIGLAVAVRILDYNSVFKPKKESKYSDSPESLKLIFVFFTWLNTNDSIDFLFKNFLS